MIVAFTTGLSDQVASGALNRTGSDGGSGYWIPTKGWSDRCVA